jgi:hypothetical protein
MSVVVALGMGGVLGVALSALGLRVLLNVMSRNTE